MIIFEKIKYENFLSTGNYSTEIDFLKNKNTLICGVNGSGKSTLIDAITYCLFGKAFRNINKPQLINSVTGKNMLVEIHFSMNNDSYIVKRGMKPNLFEIYQNQTLINQAAENKDYQSILEKSIIKMNYKSFCQVVVLGSANFTPFMLLPAAQRRAFVEDLLDIQLFSVMNNLLKEKVAENKELLINCDTQIKLTEKSLEINRKNREEANKNIESIIQTKNESISKIESENEKNKQRLKTIDTDIDKLQNTISKSKPKVLSALDKVYKSRTLLDSKIQQASKTVSFFEDNSSCPVCEQEITNAFKENKISSIKIKKEEQNVLLEQLKEKIKTLENKQEEIVSLISDLQGLNSVRLRLLSEISFNEKTIESFRKDIDDLMKKQISVVDNADLLSELRECHITKQKLLEQKEIYNVGLVLLKDGGIKAKIIKQYIPIINSMINNYLDQMEFFCQFTMDETFEEKIKSRYRDDFSFESFSEGEKMRLNLAILFTWRELAKMRNSAATNLLILDEIMDSSLDSNGTDEFIKIIHTLTKNNNVFVISHKTDQILDRFDRVIKFEKRKNFSYITE
jgi:DNA repair exonuclease SbcCD ATPase subunit